MGYKVIFILGNIQHFFIIKQQWNFLKIDMCEDRLDAVSFPKLWVGLVGPIYKRQTTLGNDSKNLYKNSMQRKKVTIPTSGPFLTRTKY